ncbi:hypothetical protein EGY05_02435 [Chryseobacterium arthrosphaerae]|nr:hypothetical protein EGY05_02435 [Chryseobacterium arthrosphaerae]
MRIWVGEFESRRVDCNELSDRFANEFLKAESVKLFYVLLIFKIARAFSLSKGIIISFFGCSFCHKNNFSAASAKLFYVLLIFKIARAFHSAKG